MGQKVNPHGFRVGVIKDWDSRWFAKDEVFGDTLVEDYNLRKFLKNKLYAAGVPKIEIERTGDNKVRIHIHCAKPGMVIGRQGSEIEKLCLECEQLLNKGNYDKGEFAIVVEIDEDYIFNKVEHTVSPEAMLVDAMVAGDISAKEAVAAVLADPNNSYSKNELKAAALRLKKLFGE